MAGCLGVLMLVTAERFGARLFFSCATRLKAGRQGTLMAAHGFSDETLNALLAALHVRAARHPHNPGLIACWPGVREDRMVAGCVELVRRGRAVQSALMAGRTAGVTRTGWAVRSNA
jgi:hypothetical protein